jgi:sensor histidine kinase YesM
MREEWDFVVSYLELEKLRLSDRLRVSLFADPEALAGVVPPFCPQPLVENAVRHAVAPRASGGSLTVEARCDGREIRLEVRDDGAGPGRGRARRGRARALARRGAPDLSVPWPGRASCGVAGGGRLPRDGGIPEEGE